MIPSIKPNPLAVPVTLKVTQPIQPNPLAVSRRDSAALAFLGAMLLVLALVMGVSMSAAASGGIQDLVRSVKAVFGAEETLVTEQQRQASVIAVLERRVHDVTAEVGGLTSRAHLARYQDAAVSDRFATIETDIAALTAEIRALRTARNEAPADGQREQAAHLERGLAAAGNDILALRSSLGAYDQAHRKDIADLAQAHRKDIADITTRVDRIEQMVASREVTGSVRPVRKKKRVRRPAAVVRSGEIAPFMPFGHPMLPGPVFSQ
jgi:hypothetical protein